MVANVWFGEWREKRGMSGCVWSGECCPIFFSVIGCRTVAFTKIKLRRLYLKSGAYHPIKIKRFILDTTAQSNIIGVLFSTQVIENSNLAM